MRSNARLAFIFPLAIVLAAALPRLAFGQAGAGSGDQRAARPPVRVGPTTVTVIEANESIDDVISRVREARRLERGRTDKGAEAGDKDRGAARDTTERARADRSTKVDKPNRPTERERIRRLRENLKERRQQREGRDTTRDLQRKGER